MIDATIISCLYGRSHDEFVDEWAAAVGELDPGPARVLVGTDRVRKIPGADLENAGEPDGYPQPFYLNAALALVRTEWVWIHDIDDRAFPDALEGLEDVADDVLQLGYRSSDGEVYVPPQLTARQLLEADRNPFVAGSCVRTAKLREVGGFPDLALQDWALWRELARAGATFQSSSRPHFYYRRHPMTRGATELTMFRRDVHLAEMIEWEIGAVAC